MKETALAGFLDIFSEREDPRIDRCKHHPMEEILLLTLCGIICHCEGWNDIEEFGHAKLEFLKQYLPYDNGIPSDDTLRRFYRRVDPNSFQSLFIEWIKSLSLALSDKPHHVAIDGKTSRRSRDGENKPLQRQFCVNLCITNACRMFCRLAKQLNSAIGKCGYQQSKHTVKD